MDPWNIGVASKGDVFEAFASIGKALANPHRLELIELLAQGEHSVEMLARMASMGVTTTSSHLQSLKQAGLVLTRRERSTIFYRLASDDVAELYLAAKRVGLRHSPTLRDALTSYLGQASPGAISETIDPAAVTADMLVLDVRPAIEFEAGHFPGALSIPQDDLPSRAGELPVDAVIVVSCRGEFCRMAREAAHWLRDRGYDARAMDEGVVEWRATRGVNLDVA